MPMQFCDVCEREQFMFKCMNTNEKIKHCTGHSDWSGPVAKHIRDGRMKASLSGGKLRDYKTPGFIVGRKKDHERRETENKQIDTLASALFVRNTKTFQDARSQAEGPRRTNVQVAVAHKVEKARLETVAYTAKRERLAPADVADTYDPLAGFHTKTRRTFKLNRAINAFDGIA